MSAPFGRVAVIGLGLIGSSITRAVQAYLPEVHVSGYDKDMAVRSTARALALAEIHDDIATAVAQAECIILAVPPGAMESAACEMAPHIRADAVISDTGSCKASVLAALSRALPDHIIIPAHPVAGTEQSGPEAGFGTLFQNRWCILTPPADTDATQVERLATFWQALGANVEVMDAQHHDLVLAVTSHLPHLIAYTIVGTADDLADVTESEVIKFSAGGFRDFTRIAASDPTMWRDVFLNNRDAVLEMLQ
ncbi:MAG: prephenate dehydrogenase/arogenate dehydrogenase family protein, partial [Alphaproteobacteria bacterium]|nr:prephenate dehydrogenase/arogenate dehydrogenase family protein [Alphaproteobacteria bacterium]